jgi:hypothetical protein
MTQLNITQLNITQLNTTQLNVIQLNITQLNINQLNITQLIMNQLNITEINITELNINELNITELETTELNITQLNTSQYLVTIKLQHSTFLQSIAKFHQGKIGQPVHFHSQLHCHGRQMQASQLTSAPIYLLPLWIYRVWLAPSLTI